MHDYNNFQAQTESVAGQNKIPYRIPNRATKNKKKKNRCAQGFLAFDTK
jgi:hypothetical protein